MTAFLIKYSIRWDKMKISKVAQIVATVLPSPRIIGLDLYDQ